MRPFKYGCVVNGDYFCPRPKLERQLRGFAEDGQNLVIYGERRIGKTSLIQHVIGGMKRMRLIYIDLYGIKTQADFCARVMRGVAKASTEISFLQRAVQLASRLRPVIAIDQTGAMSLSVDARAAAEPNSLDTVMEALGKLASDKRTCIVFDEFQDVLGLEDAWKLLAEMRSTIQFQTDTAYFFTGSVRNEMMSIFDDNGSPFYKSALPFSVNEIDSDDFSAFIIKKFSQGNRKITHEVVTKILEFADGVTGDVQEMCEALWETTDAGCEITEDDFASAFELVFSRELRGYESIVVRLTRAQTAFLRALAKLRSAKMFSQEFCELCGLSTSSIRRVISRLVADQVIFVHRKEYRFSNPFFRAWLIRNG